MSCFSVKQGLPARTAVAFYLITATGQYVSAHQNQYGVLDFNLVIENSLNLQDHCVGFSAI